MGAKDKKRKRGHHERKEMLHKEIRMLESGVAVLTTQGMPSHDKLLHDPVLLPTAREYAELRYAMELQQLRVARIQSALLRCETEQQFYPLYSRICLTKDWDQRRRALLSIREKKLQAALDYVSSRAQFNGLSKTQFSENKFETGDGALCCVRYETVQFRGIKSLQQVFDALSFYTTNMEIITSEQLGHLTLRDDFDTVEEDKAFHSRILTTNESGITTECNIVSYRQLYGDCCGVILVDFIDQDEVYPFIPSRRVRRDASGAIVLTAERNGGELTVTMRRAAFLKLHRPQFSVSAVELQELHDDTMKWADVMLKSVRGMLYSAGQFRS